MTETIYDHFLKELLSHAHTELSGVKFIDFDLTYTGDSAEGRLKWNADDGTLEVGMPGGSVNLQIGQETLIRAINNQGAQINNGDIVRISGGTGNFPDIQLADKSSIATAGSIGFATENILDGQKGYVTNFGLVRDVNTSGMAAGSLLWLGDDGAYTTTVPTAPDIKVVVGVVIREHATEGIVFAAIQITPRLRGLSDVYSPSTPSDNDFVYWDSANSRFATDGDSENVKSADAGDYFVGENVEEILQEIGETEFHNGFDTQTDLSMPDLAFDSVTRTFSCSVKGAASNFYFWAHGKKITKTTTQSVVIPDVTGTYYIVFDNTGTLVYVEAASLVAANFYENAIAGVVYWNATAGTAMAGTELHGIRMSSRTHHYNHSTFGARYESGINIDGLAASSKTYTQTTSGYFWDEDIRHTISLKSTAPFIYRLGAAGEWTGTTADNEVGYKEVADTYYSWNEWTGSTWQLTEGGVLSDYFITFFIATPDFGSYPIKKIIGHNAYANVTAARNAIENEREALNLEGLPSPEIVFLYAVIVKRDGNLQELSDGSLFYDFRISKGAGGGTSGTASVAGDVATDVANFNNNLSSADTDVQKALDTLDNLTVSGGEKIEMELRQRSWML